MDTAIDIPKAYIRPTDLFASVQISELNALFVYAIVEVKA